MYRGDGNYRLANNFNYQELFSRIVQLRKIADFFGDIRGRRILDAGCGTGWVSLYFARSGAETHSCDVSAKGVAVARRYASANGLLAHICLSVAAAEALHYSEESFDFIFMNAALHHCEIAAVSRELHRILKAGGKIALMEDYGYHPVMNVYRSLSRRRHTSFERPLLKKDAEEFVEAFSWHEFEYFHLLNLYDQEWFLKPGLEKLDSFLMRKWPFLKHYCRLIGIYAQK